MQATVIEKQRIAYDVTPLGAFSVGQFCAALVRRCASAEVLREVFDDPSSASATRPFAVQASEVLTAFQFVTRAITVLVSHRVTACVDLLAFRLQSAQRLKEVQQKVNSRQGDAVATLGDFMRPSAAAFNKQSGAASSFDEVKTQEDRVQSGAPLPSTDEVAAARSQALRRAERSAWSDWERSLYTAFCAQRPTTVNGELEYFASAAVLEYCLLMTFVRVDASCSGRITWSDFASFLADCTAPAPDVGATVSQSMDMLLPANDQRCKALDTAMRVVPWIGRGRRCLVTLNEENYSQSVSVVDELSLTELRSFAISESTGKVTSIDVLPSLNVVVLMTYGSIRLHDADNFLCKAVLVEKEAVTCVRLLEDSRGLLLAGNQAGQVLRLDLGDMDRYFYSTNKPYAIQVVERRQAHSETVTDILQRCVATNFVVTASMDGTIVMHHLELASAKRVFSGPSVLNVQVAEHLGLLVCYGLDTVPFVYSYNVPGSECISLGNSATRGHPKRIVFLGFLEDEDHVVTIDRTGTAKVWSLPTNSCVQTLCCTDGLDGTAAFIGFHAAIEVQSDFIVIGRRRAFRFDFNKSQFGRVRAKASQKSIHAVAYDDACHLVCMACAGLELLLFDAVRGRLIDSRKVDFLPPPAGAPHGSEVDRVNSMAYTPDRCSLLVASDKYCLNIHCAATLVHRSRHVFPLRSGTLLRAVCAVIPGHDASCTILSFSNDNPKMILHKRILAVMNGTADSASGGGGWSAQPAAHGVAIGTHCVDRVVLATASDTLRVRIATVDMMTDTLLTSELPPVTVSDPHASASSNILSAWARLPNGSWGRCDSHTFDEPIAGIETRVRLLDGAGEPSSSPCSHFIVTFPSGRIAVCVLVGTAPALRELRVAATFVHRRGGNSSGVGALDGCFPTAVALHATVPRVVAVGDDSGAVTWYDLGDCLHRLVKGTDDVIRCANHGCSTDVADGHTYHATVWAIGQTPPQSDYVAGLLQITLPHPLGATLFSAQADGEARYWRLQGSNGAAKLASDPRSVPFIDAAKRIQRDERFRLGIFAHAIFEGSHQQGDQEGDGGTIASTAGLPSQCTKGCCDTDGFGRYFQRCNDFIQPSHFDGDKKRRQPTHRKRGSPDGMGGNGVIDTASPATTTLRLGSTPTTLVASPATLVDDSAGEATFLTSVAAAARLPGPRGAVPNTADDIEGLGEHRQSIADSSDSSSSALPPLRSIRGLGLTHEQTIGMYKEWMFGMQVKLNGAERLERLRILHAIQTRKAVDVVNELLQTDDAVFEDAKSRRSPRLNSRTTVVSPSSALHDGGDGMTGDSALSAVPSERLPPKHPRLLKLGNPKGRVRRDVTDVPSFEARIYTLPPRVRESQMEEDLAIEQLKARHAFNQRENLSKDAKRAMLQTVEGMPPDAFRNVLRQEAKRASAEEDSVGLSTAGRLRRGGSPEPARSGGILTTTTTTAVARSFPTRSGLANSNASAATASYSQLMSPKYPRAAGGAATTAALPKYVIDATSRSLQRPMGGSMTPPPPRLPPMLDPVADTAERRGFCVGMDLKPRRGEIL